jgi:hypothetical protein
LDVLIPPLTLIVTSSKEAVQGAFAIVHLNTLAPTPNPDTAEVGLFAFAKVPVPLITVHVPVPAVAVLPARVVDVAQID